MKEMLSQIRSAVLATLVLAVVCCGLYPLAVWGFAQVFFPRQANGSLIVGAGGIVQGSRLIGQPCSSDRYFHPRPSAAGYGFDPTSSGGRNLGPTSRKLRDLIARGVSAYRAENGLPPGAPVPADAVTASGSGLDPDISPWNADLQAPRVARARGLPLAQVLRLVRRQTKPPAAGLLGEARVNVLEVNLALDGLQ
jgi:K+-transporting ATPase ATPase C chain